jgi:hypothetical protein
MPLAEFTLELEGGSAFDSEARRAGLILLAALLLSFAFIRFSTRMIRAEVSWWPGNVTPGGLHIHHLVFGIVLLLVAGFLQFAFQPGSPWLEVLAALFGIGAGLTLDEFALWLYLEDVYWAEEGRRSVDAVILAVILGGGIVLGLAPISDQDGLPGILAAVAIALAICLTAAYKGKLWSAVAGMFFFPIGLTAAIRLAQPGSPWARRFYEEGSDKLAKAQARKERHDRRFKRFQDMIGGAPSIERPADRE